VTLDDSDPTPDFSSQLPGEASFADLSKRLAELEERSWVESDDTIDDHTRRTIFERIFPHGHTEGAWADYHWVRSEHDRLAGEEFDLGQ
jgi:hypothetical protein